MCVCCAHTPFGPVKLVASVIRRDIKFKSYQFDITWGNTLPKSSRCTRIARLGQHMSPCIYFFTVKVLKSIYRWFIMLPPWDRGKERDRQSEIEMAFASGIAACDTVGRWWILRVLLGCQFLIKTRSVPSNWRWSGKFASYATALCTPSPTIPSLKVFFLAAHYTAHRWFGGRICKWTAYQCTNGTGNSDSWLTEIKKEKNIYLLRTWNVMKNI